ncbi:hypothetical protein ACW0JT_18285 [Arthrobacter sp. SA17]
MKIKGNIKLDGTFTTRRALPDEEVFESLAARVRPLTLASESIYFKKVFDALNRLVQSSPAPLDPEMGNRLTALLAGWSAIDLDGTGQLAFWIVTERRDGSDKSPRVSDVQLAASWMYADLVHSNPKKTKQDGLRFPIKERYSAAVNVFSRLTLLTLETYDVIMQLHETGTIALDPLVLETDVIVGVSELVEEGVAYVSPMDIPMPDGKAALGDLPRDWERFTPTVLLRRDSRNHVHIVMTTRDGAVVGTYDAAVSRRWQKGEAWHWAVLIADVVTAEFSFTFDDGAVTDIQFVGLTSAATTNRMQLAEVKLLRDMGMAEEIRFFVADRPLASLRTPFMEAEEAERLDVSVDTLEDLTAIEQLIDQPLALLHGLYTMHDRVRLRQARLLLEGHVVPFAVSPMKVTAARGEIPKVVIRAAEAFVLGDETSIPFPQVAIRHPLMRPEAVTEALNSDPPQDIVVMAIPADEPFVAWAPELLVVDDDEGLQQPVRLGLCHVEEAGPFGGVWDGSISGNHGPS